MRGSIKKYTEGISLDLTKLSVNSINTAFACVNCDEQNFFNVSYNTLWPFIIFRSVEMLCPLKMTGIPIYRGINARSDPSWVKTDKSNCSSCFWWKFDTNSDEIVSWATDKKSSGLEGFLVIISAFFHINW